MGTAEITGTWEVKIIATGGTQVPLGSKWTAFIMAHQNGSTVSGTFLTVHGMSGQLTGSVSEDEVSMTIDQGPIRPGTFQGIAKVTTNNKRMSGTYSGADSGGSLQASFMGLKRELDIVQNFCSKLSFLIHIGGHVAHLDVRHGIHGIVI